MNLKSEEQLEPCPFCKCTNLRQTTEDYSKFYLFWIRCSCGLSYCKDSDELKELYRIKHNSDEEKISLENMKRTFIEIWNEIDRK